MSLLLGNTILSMKRKASALLLLAWIYVCSVYGQDNLIQRIDSMAERMYYRTKVDTNYIKRPDSRWIVKMRANVSGAEIETHGIIDGSQYESVLRSSVKETLSLSLAYRGLALGFSFNPAHLHGKNNDMELNLSSYGNRIGGEIVYHSAKTFSGTVSKEGVESTISSGLVEQLILSVNGYYAFNHRRFSYPAALSQSYYQLRSAGSWLLGFSFWGGSIKVGRSEALDNKPLNMRMTQLGIGGGYGYNFVAGHRWLFHLSALSAFVVYGHNSMETGDVSRKMSYHFPEVIITGRGAVIYRFSNCFTGVSMVTHILNIGTPEKMQFIDSKWRARLFFGFLI